MWQQLRSELHSQGLEIVTVALDTDTKWTMRWIEKAAPEHPSLIDRAHLVDELFGIVNVPSGVWIDEDGMIVRPPEPAPAQRPPERPSARAQQDAVLSASMAESAKLRNESEKYIAALRDWVAKGKESRYALTPDEVVERSRPRGVDEATAAAHFELGQHAYRAGREDDAVRHFREAHRLDFANWTYKRQAWSLADPSQGPTEQYEGDWLSDVKKIGAENYYPALQMD